MFFGASGSRSIRKQIIFFSRIPPHLEKDSKKNRLFYLILHGVMDKVRYHFTLVKTETVLKWISPVS